ncbi:hypothetical protein GCM10010918_15890 [Paenibacillus radicis (ex Gao et al. 2016)]|uniref:Uncharacterized protein n=1 Tax=Paenibacillus radicis (ex Gao et al. 2016) TaxID=1737354 RepID=A0A917GZP7_9BACL|nr:hypothetical protein GCM10010918_15890 [Paenibacillus radicis (ex Gao et al. 2016)]
MLPDKEKVVPRWLSDKFFPLETLIHNWYEFSFILYPSGTCKSTLIFESAGDGLNRSLARKRMFWVLVIVLLSAAKLI